MNVVIFTLSIWYFYWIVFSTRNPEIEPLRCKLPCELWSGVTDPFVTMPDSVNCNNEVVSWNVTYTS